MKGCEFQMNVFKQFYKSLYSPKDMALFRFQGIGKTIGYVFLLMFICSSITAVSIGNDLRKFSAMAIDKIATDLPEFTLNNSELTSELDSPLITENYGFTFIFDTTGELTAEDVFTYTNAIGLLKNEAVFVSETERQRLPYSTFGNLTINKEMLIKSTEQFKTIILILLPIAFIFMYLLQTSFKLIGISFLALIGLIIANQLKRSLPYSAFWILSAYAVTIPTLFFAITDALKIHIPFAIFLYWMTASIVLYLIIVEIPKSKQSQHNDDPKLPE